MNLEEKDYSIEKLMFYALNKGRGSILYNSKWAIMLGDARAALLLNQIFFWWSNNHYKPFYKFKEPCGHSKYNVEDSWVEELGMTRKVFDAMLKKFAEPKKNEEKIPNALVYYQTDMNRLTWYEINPEAFYLFVKQVYEKFETEKGIVSSLGIYEKHHKGYKYRADKDFVYIKEYNIEYLDKEENSENLENLEIQHIDEPKPKEIPVKINPIKKVEPINQLIEKEEETLFSWQQIGEERSVLIQKHFEVFKLRGTPMTNYNDARQISYMLMSKEIEADYPVMLEYYHKLRTENLQDWSYSLFKWLSEGWKSCDWEKVYLDLSSKKAAKAKDLEEKGKKFGFKDTSTPTSISLPKKPVNGFSLPK